MVESGAADEGMFPQGVGERLRIMREAAGLDLNDVATRTRIPLRHLDAIERGNYAELPSPTYALGFTRSYARALNVDEAPLVAALREELGREDPAKRGHLPYEPVDPSRVPSRLLAWTAAGLAVLFAIAYGVWRSQAWGPDNAAMPPVVVTRSEVPAAAPATSMPSAPATAGSVVLTATAPVWFRIYDGSKTRLFEKELAVGESYTVPDNAVEPKILTGRPDALRVTVGGREVAALGPAEKTIKDVGVSAAALAARSDPAVTTGTTSALPTTN